jgi:hypothetical protein
MFPISYGVCKALEDAKRKTIKISIVQSLVDENKDFLLTLISKHPLCLSNPAESPLYILKQYES